MRLRWQVAGVLAWGLPSDTLLFLWVVLTSAGMDLQGPELAVYLRVALGIAFSRKDNFAVKLARFSKRDDRRRVSEGLGLLASTMFNAIPVQDVGTPMADPREWSLRQAMFDIQLWYLMAADLRREFPGLQAAYANFVNNTALGAGRFDGAAWQVAKPVVQDLLLKGAGRKATLLHPNEVANVYKLLCMTQHVPDRCHVSQTNIEAVISMVSTRRSQAEWFLLVVVTGEVSSLSLASLIMAFTGSSGRLLLVYSSPVMEGLRVANCLPVVHQTPMVERQEVRYKPWNVVEGFGSPAANTVTASVSEHWRSLADAEGSPLWRKRLESLVQVPWTTKVAGR